MYLQGFLRLRGRRAVWLFRLGPVRKARGFRRWDAPPRISLAKLSPAALLWPPVDTDHIFLELFRDHPEWLRELTGLPLSAGCRGSSLVLKQLEIRCDLVLEPGHPADPCLVVEFQLYHDHSIYNRVELGRQILWRQINPRKECRRRDYLPREVDAAVVFGSRSEMPPGRERHPRVRVLFLDELLDALERRDPASPLLAALAPLREPLLELEKNAAAHYRRIGGSDSLPREDRDLLGEIFVLLLLQRFNTKTREEIRTMIAELTPLRKTRAGRELLEEGIERGVEKGIERGVAELVRRMAGKGRTSAEISELTDLSVEEIARFLAAPLDREQTGK